MQERKGELQNAITSLHILSQRLSQASDTSFTKSIPQLKFLLQKNNLKFHYPQETVDRCANHLVQKGIKLPTVDEIIKSFNLSKNIHESNKTHESCYFYVKDLSLSNMKQLIHKAHQYSVFNNIQTVMCDYQDIDLDGYCFDNIGQVKLNSSFRNQNKFKQYNQIISTFITSSINRQTVSSIQLLRLFYHASKNQLWNLIIKIFENVDVQASFEEIQRQLIRNSISLLEEEYNKRLPNNFRSFEVFVQDQYINKLGDGKNYVHYNRQGQPIWAIVYTLLRAGRFQDIKQLEGEIEYSKLFSDFSSYLSGERKVYQIEGANKDIFLDAIYSIFNKKPECSFEILNNERDFIWFSLKTISFEFHSRSNSNSNAKSEFSLASLQQQIYNRYLSNSNQYNYINLIYCLAFDKLTEPNPYLDQDDSNHFLIFLHLIFAGQQNDCWSKQTRNQFYQKMSNYSQQIIGRNLELALDYTVISIDKNYNPIQSVLNTISDLLIYNQFVERFFGQPPCLDTPIQLRIRDALQPNKQQYDNFITNTMNKYASTSKNYIYPSKVFEYLVGNTNKSIQYLLDVLVKDILGNNSFSEEQVAEITNLISRIQSNDKLTGAYNRLLQFIQLTKYLKDMIVFDQPVHQNIFKSKYSPLKQQDISSVGKQILLDLSNTEYLSIYAVFLSYFVKAIEKFYSYKPQKVKDYKEAIRGIRRHFDDLRGHGITKVAGVAYKQKMNEIEKELDFIRV